MSITRQIDKEKAELKIVIDGRFDFSLHKLFRDAYSDVAPQSMRFTVDLSRASYLDSSALGMLLLLREHAGGDQARVRLIGTNKDVLRVLKIANFDHLFKFE